MCVDANAGARAQARAQARKQDAVHRQRALSFWNREAQFKRNLDRSVVGLSRDQSDIYQNALYQAGQGRLSGQKAYTNYLRTKKVNEGGRSRKYGKANKKALQHVRLQEDPETMVKMSEWDAYNNWIRQLLEDKVAKKKACMKNGKNQIQVI